MCVSNRFIVEQPIVRREVLAPESVDGPVAIVMIHAGLVESVYGFDGCVPQANATIAPVAELPARVCATSQLLG